MQVQHIYWFAYFSKDEPSVRYRAVYPLQKIAKDYHVSYTIIYPGYKPQNVFIFIKAYCSILFFRKRKSVIVFEKLRTRRLYVMALKLLLLVRNKKTLYDIDDADYLKFPPQSIQYFMKKCAACTTGSNVLLNYTGSFNSKVYHLTSPVISHRYKKYKRNDVFTIGWVGYFNAHKESLFTLFFPALKNVTFPVRLVLLGVQNEIHVKAVEGFFAGNTNIILDMPQDIEWLNENNVYARIAEFDIGVAPLINTEVNRAKSAFKLKQYLSCGVPVLASGIGENNLFVNEGINGFICNTPEDYQANLIRLKEMENAAYWSLSGNAINTASHFSLDNYCFSLMQCLSEI